MCPCGRRLTAGVSAVMPSRHSTSPLLLMAHRGTTSTLPSAEHDKIVTSLKAMGGTSCHGPVVVSLHFLYESNNKRYCIFDTFWPRFKTFDVCLNIQWIHGKNIILSAFEILSFNQPHQTNENLFPTPTVNSVCLFSTWPNVGDGQSPSWFYSHDTTWTEEKQKIRAVRLTATHTHTHSCWTWEMFSSNLRWKVSCVLPTLSVCPFRDTVVHGPVRHLRTTRNRKSLLYFIVFILFIHLLLDWTRPES